MITELYAKTIFSFIRDCQTVFQFCVSNTTMRHRVSVAPRHCQQMILPVFLDFSLSQRCVVLSHYYSTWIRQRQTCWASFHILLGHLCIFFGKMSTQIFAHILIELFSYCWIKTFFIKEFLYFVQIYTIY